MPVCRFFLQGSCRYGDRCFNEHPRGQRQGGRSQRWEEDDYQQRQSGRGGSYGYSESPMTRHNKKSNFGFANDEIYDDRQYSRGTSHKGKQDRYHWTPESRNPFAPLQNEQPQEKTQGLDDDVIIKTVKEDIKVWAESKMWPYSCYSYSKGKKCIDGLPDISPEELRTIAYLHKSSYGSIMNEMDLNFSRRKDELFAMSPEVKSHLRSIENDQSGGNPSAGLKILMLYGPEHNFVPQNPTPTPANAIEFPKAQPNVPMTSQSVSQTTNVFGVTLQPSSTPIPSGIRTTSQSNQPTLSLFGSSIPDKKESTDATGKKSKVYTDLADLTQWEVRCFQADRFTMGEIPTRPPAQQHCR